MHIKRLAVCLGILALATPALGAQFWIVQDPATNRCTIAEAPPAPGAGVIVGDGAYGDRATAEADMSKMAVCSGAAG